MTPNIDYYRSLLTSQYQDSPNLKAFLEIAMQPLFRYGHASGTTFTGTSAAHSESVTLLSVSGTGFKAQFLFTHPSGATVTGSGSSRLFLSSDDDYRILLKATIAQNQWNGQLGSLYPVWQSLFPGGRIYVTDHQNMTADVIVAGNFSSNVLSLILSGYVVPRPQGVQYNISLGTLPFFGFDRNDATVAGLDSGRLV